MHSGLKEGARLIVEGVDINSRGQGVAKVDNLPVIFVDNLLPKEGAEIEIKEVKRDYAIGKILRLLRVSPLRMDPLCPYYESCGGCQLQHLSYPHQFHIKLQRIQREMELHLKEPISVGKYYYSVPLRYRNKLTFHIRGTVHQPRIGFFKMDSHDVVDVNLCLLAYPSIEESYINFRELILTYKGEPFVEPYNEESGTGFLRSVTFRAAYPVSFDFNSKENTPSGVIQVMTIVTLNLPRYDSSDARIEELEKLLKGLKGSNSVVFDFNSRKGNRIFGNKTRLIRGRLSLRQTFLTRNLGRIHYFYGPYNFFQVNPWVAVHMIDTAVEWMGDLKTTVDLYCGVGVFGIALAKAGVKRVVGIEVDATAKKYVRKTLTENSILPERFEFKVGKVEQVDLSWEDFEGVVVDPPRKGLEPEVIKRIARARRILYFSCNPSTLIRDLIALKSLGFNIVEIRAFDMFPQTTHLELGVLLQR